ncbi:MAG: YybS family protein [Selenomonadaceae bacterium]|nr:YybS family protein [Selenomonadaceae bacterium]MBR1859082.1 YybS family protein [Selenomonadaceae bacterium]
MKNSNITPTVEVGLIVAIAVILGLISTYLPLIGTIVDFFWSLPFVIIVIRQGLNKATYALIAALILLSMFIGPVFAIRLVLSFGLSGLALGFAIQKNFDAVRIFMMTLMVSFTAQVISVLLLLFVMDINVMDMQISMVEESFEETFALYQSMGMDQAQIDEAKAQVEPAIQLLSMLMPTLLLLMALINTLACFYTAKWILPKINLSIPDFPPFAEWRFPVAFLYLMVLALLGLYWGGTRNLSILYTVSINANILALFVGFIQGLSLLSFAANRLNVSKVIRRLVFVLLILNFMLFQVVSFTGLFDMFFDYRRRFSERK